jgi:hypothetical protein
VLSDKGRMLVNDLNNIEKQISQFEYERVKANDEIEKTTQNRTMAPIRDKTNNGPIVDLFSINHFSIIVRWKKLTWD